MGRRVREPDAAVPHAMQVAAAAHRPVIIADTQDNPGVGGDSNTTGMLRAAPRCTGRRDRPDLRSIGRGGGARGWRGRDDQHRTGRLSADRGLPAAAGAIPGRGIVGRQKFVYGGPMMNGKASDLGPMAQAAHRGVRIAVSSAKARCSAGTWPEAVGIEPRRMKILVNKSSVHFRADFAAIAKRSWSCARRVPSLPTPRICRGRSWGPACARPDWSGLCRRRRCPSPELPAGGVGPWPAR